MKAFACIAAAATLLALAAPASAQFAKPEDAVKYRQSALSVMGTHFGRLGAMANGKVPFDAKVAADNAELVAAMAKLPWAGFRPRHRQGRAAARPSPKSGPSRPSSRKAADKLVAEVSQAGRRRQDRQPRRAEDRFCRDGRHLQVLPRRFPQQVSALRRRADSLLIR